MFNFHAESNAQVILKSMQKETIVAESLNGLDLLQRQNPMPKIGPHKNIVKMYTAFADQIPQWSQSLELYPQALPPRLNPVGGYGRNMSLFVVMRRYDTNLRSYLQDRDLSWRSSLIILTQILEALVHLTRLVMDLNQFLTAF